MITVILCLLYIAGESKVVHSGGGPAGDDYDVSGKLVVLMQLLVYNYDRLVSSQT